MTCIEKTVFNNNEVMKKLSITIINQELIHNHSKIALRYQEEISKWSDPEYYDLNVLKIQLPYVAPANPTITAEQQKERKRELAKRLMEINARKREERVRIIIIIVTFI